PVHCESRHASERRSRLLGGNHANGAKRASARLNLHDFEGDLQIQRSLSALRRRQTHRDELRYGTHFQDTHLKARRQLHGGDLERESKLHGCLHRGSRRLWLGYRRGRGFGYWSGWSLGCFWHGCRCCCLRKYRLSGNSIWKIRHGLGSRFAQWKLSRSCNDLVRLLLRDRFNCKFCCRFYGRPCKFCARKRLLTRLLRGQYGFFRISEKFARFLRGECYFLSIFRDLIRLLRSDRRNFGKLTGC